MIGTLVPPAGKLLVLVNGAYGRRMVRMCEYYRRACVVAGDGGGPAGRSRGPRRRAGGAIPAITHVVVVHCETTSGVLNPVEEIAAVTARHRRRLLIDAMSAFGAHPARRRGACPSTPWWPPPTSASRACRGWASRSSGATALEEARGPGAVAEPRPARPVGGDGEERAVALHAADPRARGARPALDQHAAEGGVAGRGARYRRNCAHAGRRAARAWASRRSCPTAAGADHRHGAHAGRSRSSTSRPSTTGWPSAAT